MESATIKQVLLKAIYEKLENAYEDTLEDVLELLEIREREDEEDIKDFNSALGDIKTNGTIPWSEVKR